MKSRHAADSPDSGRPIRSIGRRQWLSGAAVTFFCALGVGLAGCVDQLPSDPIRCLASVEYGLWVEVRDDSSGEPSASGAVVVATEGDYVETLEIVQIGGGAGLVAFGAAERPGVYSLTVEKEGYLPWSRSFVVVGANECHVEPVTVEARLTPVSGMSGGS